MVSDDEYKRRKETLLAERVKLEERIADTGQRADNWIERVEKTFEFAKTAKERFETGNTEDKRAITVALGSEFTLEDGVLTIELHEVWQKMSIHAEPVRNGAKALELAEKRGEKERTKVFASLVPSWQGR